MQWSSSKPLRKEVHSSQLTSPTPITERFLPFPGNLDHRFSTGCNRLIQQQRAIIFTNVEELAKELNWDLLEGGVVRNRDQSLESFSKEERLIIELLTSDKKGLEIDKLAWKSQLTVNQLASVLLSLEFSGVIKVATGKRYQLRNVF